MIIYEVLFDIFKKIPTQIICIKLLNFFKGNKEYVFDIIITTYMATYPLITKPII